MHKHQTITSAIT